MNAPVLGWPGHEGLGLERVLLVALVLTLGTAAVLVMIHLMVAPALLVTTLASANLPAALAPASHLAVHTNDGGA